MEKIRMNSRVVSGIALLATFCIFFLFVSASSAQSGIEATVTVGLGANVDCKPDYIDFKYQGSYITCYIELLNDDMKKIDPYSLTLTVPGRSGQVQAKPFPQGYGDYDRDRIPDRMVYFDSKAVNKILQYDRFPETVAFNVSGKVNGVPFSGTDNVRIIRSALPFTIILNVFAYVFGFR